MSEAYNTLLKHLDRPPPRSGGGGSSFGRSPFGFSFHEPDADDIDDYDDYDEYNDDEDSEYEDMDFYMYAALPSCCRRFIGA